MSGRSYFGYGERTPDVMAAIIGRMPEYESAVLPGFQLFIQRVIDMTPAVQEIMAINRTPEEMGSLRNYAAKRTEGAHLPGYVYRNITDREMPFVGNFDIEGLWFNLQVDKLIHVANDGGKTARLDEADVHTDPTGELVVPAEPFSGPFPPALSLPARTIEIATATRLSFQAE